MHQECNTGSINFNAMIVDATNVWKRAIQASLGIGVVFEVTTISTVATDSTGHPNVDVVIYAGDIHSLISAFAQSPTFTSGQVQYIGFNVFPLAIRPVVVTSNDADNCTEATTRDEWLARRITTQVDTHSTLPPQSFVPLLVHELGHTFGLGHDCIEYFDAALDSPVDTTTTTGQQLQLLISDIFGSIENVRAYTEINNLEACENIDNNPVDLSDAALAQRRSPGMSIMNPFQATNPWALSQNLDLVTRDHDFVIYGLQSVYNSAPVSAPASLIRGAGLPRVCACHGLPQVKWCELAR